MFTFNRFSSKESAAQAICAVHGNVIAEQPVKCSWGKESNDPNQSSQQTVTNEVYLYLFLVICNISEIVWWGMIFGCFFFEGRTKLFLVCAFYSAYLVVQKETSITNNQYTCAHTHTHTMSSILFCNYSG